MPEAALLSFFGIAVRDDNKFHIFGHGDELPHRIARKKRRVGPLIIVVVGTMLFLLGVGRFVVRHGFMLHGRALCCLVLFPAGLLLSLLLMSFNTQDWYPLSP
jgi:hypothetical protein